MSDEKAHSPIGASGMYRWSVCPGSVNLSKGIKQASSSYAQEGTTAHEIAEKSLNNKYFGEGKPDVPHDFPAEGMLAIKTYVEYIGKKVNELGCTHTKEQIQIEYQFDISSVFEGLYGTADCVLYGEAEKKLVVIDYKHGAGIAVEVKDNLQLQYYALGAMLKTGLPCKTVEIVVVQPRCEHFDGPIRSWTISAFELVEFADILAEAAKKTQDPKAELKAGSHCRFCPASTTKCPEIHKKALATAKMQFSPAQDYDSDKLKTALDMLPSVEAWIKNVKEYSLAEGLKGRTPEGYKMVNKRAVRKWNVGQDDVIKFLEKLAPRIDFINKSVKTPTQVEKLLPKDMKVKIKDLVSKNSSGQKLVAISEPGEAVKLDPKSQFKQLEG